MFAEREQERNGLSEQVSFEELRENTKGFFCTCVYFANSSGLLPLQVFIKCHSIKIEFEM